MLDICLVSFLEAEEPISDIEKAGSNTVKSTDLLNSI
jgi:hypothetical protein